MRIEVRNNNVDKAMRILKKKLTEEGFFNELREREFYMCPRVRNADMQRAAAKRSA